MQEAATEVRQWFGSNNMKVNPIKTKEMLVVFSQNIPLPPNITIDSIAIERVNNAKLLGLIISSDMKWQSHIDYIYTRASSKLYGLIMLKKSRSFTVGLSRRLSEAN